MVQALIQLCISKTGMVESVTVQRSTGFIDYDRKLQREMQQWRYRPGALPDGLRGACLPFRFVYSLARDEVTVDG